MSPCVPLLIVYYAHIRSNVDVIGSIVPFFCSRTVPYDWNYTTVPQPGLNGQIVTYPRKVVEKNTLDFLLKFGACSRGRILGGSSSINCLVYTYVYI